MSAGLHRGPNMPAEPSSAEGLFNWPQKEEVLPGGFRPKRLGGLACRRSSAAEHDPPLPPLAQTDQGQFYFRIQKSGRLWRPLRVFNLRLIR